MIEPRVLAHFADYEEMLDVFRAGGDPYATFGETMFNIPGLTMTRSAEEAKMLAELLTGKDDGVAGMVAEMTKQHAIMAEALLRQGRDASDRLERLLMAQHALVTQQLAFALNVANAQAAKAATIRPVRPGLGSTARVIPW